MPNLLLHEHCSENEDDRSNELTTERMPVDPVREQYGINQTIKLVVPTNA
jgi:hypothetical protein